MSKYINVDWQIRSYDKNNITLNDLHYSEQQWNALSDSDKREVLQDYIVKNLVDSLHVIIWKMSDLLEDEKQ